MPGSLIPLAAKHSQMKRAIIRIEHGYGLHAKPGYGWVFLMPKQPDEILQKMRLIARTEPSPVGGRGRRSKLFLWLSSRSDDFQAFLDEQQPSWTTIAKAFEGTEVSDGTGKPPSAARVRKAWLEVRQAKGLAEKRTRKTDKPPFRTTTRASFDAGANCSTNNGDT